MSGNPEEIALALLKNDPTPPLEDIFGPSITMKQIDEFIKIDPDFPDFYILRYNRIVGAAINRILDECSKISYLFEVEANNYVQDMHGEGKADSSGYLVVVKVIMRQIESALEVLRSKSSQINENEVIQKAKSNLERALETYQKLIPFYEIVLAAKSDDEELLKLQPYSSMSFNIRGIGFLNEMYSVKDYDKALELNPYNYFTYSNRGNQFFDMGKHELSIIEMTKSLKLVPFYNIAILYRAQAHFEISNYELALSDLNSVIDRVPNNPQYFFIRAQVHNRMHIFFKALKDINLAINLNPNFSCYFTYRGIIFAQKSLPDMDSAIKDFSKSLEMTPESEQPRDWRAWCYYVKRDYDLAISDYNVLIKRGHHRDFLCYFRRGRCFLGQEKFEEAIVDFSKCAINSDERREESLGCRNEAVQLLKKKIMRL